LTTPDAVTPDHPGPVFVDLDGTLIRSDLLWESLCLFLRKHPFRCAFQAPIWLLGGKASFKARLAAWVVPDATHLPYRREVLSYLERQRDLGREIVLASASHRAWVQAVADHLGLFDDVLASDGESNLAGPVKLAAIQERVGTEGFEYLGNSAADLSIWEHAETCTLVAPTRAARSSAGPSATLVPPDEIWRPLLRAIRPHQWAKNALMFAPLFLAHEVSEVERTLHTLLAFVCFCAAASAGYLINDLVDIDADRQHPTKRRRPFAAGTLSIQVGIVLAVLLLIASFASSFRWLPPLSTLMLAGYLALTLSYSLYFKQKLLLDVLILAGLYTHRVLAGGVAAEVRVSPWLLAFSAFFFLSLALVKRYVELLHAQENEREGIARRAYQVGDLSLVETMGLSCAYISVLVLCLFISSDDVTRLYSTPGLLWLMCPVMLYWISRIWLLARRGELDDDPVLFATTDPISYLSGVLVLAVVMAAAW
jgi:4-hydroxybenzoate polyprenyltransferase/phosphoserine phosphatase